MFFMRCVVLCNEPSWKVMLRKEQAASEASCVDSRRGYDRLVDSSEITDLERQGRLLERLRTLPGSVVAFSGGVDSSYLLWAAAEALGSSRVRAVLGVSPSVPKVQVDQAVRVAERLAVPLETLETRELDDDRYRANRGDRCYFCKDTLFATLAGIAVPDGWALLDGTNRDASPRSGGCRGSPGCRRPTCLRRRASPRASRPESR
jgi:PP-loop superfamily ATP-utilizing enzyme